MRAAEIITPSHWAEDQPLRAAHSSPFNFVYSKNKSTKKSETWETICNSCLSKIFQTESKNYQATGTQRYLPPKVRYLGFEIGLEGYVIIMLTLETPESCECITYYYILTRERV